MDCYRCVGRVLKPVKLDHGLPPRECDSCGGVHIDLLNYRAWSEENAVAAETTATVDVPLPADNTSALICQRCSRIMLKYRVSTDHQNFVDICTSCDDIWLDSGEWGLIKHLALQAS